MAKTQPSAALLPRLDEQLCFAVYLAGHAFNRMYRAALAELRLTYPQYLVMLVLWECDGLTVKALGERLILDSGTLTPLLKRLQTAGLIRRERCRDDERQVRLFLTEPGDRLRDKAACVPATMACAIGNSAERNAQLVTDLLTLQDALLKAAKKA